MIVVQVSFTRLVGYKLFYHFVFLAISLSLLGLGAAGTYVAVRRPPADTDRSLHAWLLALGLSIPIAFLLIANPFGVTHHPPIRTKLLGWDAIAYLAWCSPLMIWLNFCGGVVLTSLFRRYSERMGVLYAADLLGAGAGSFAAVTLMKYLSPPLAFTSTALLPVIAALGYRPALAPGDAARRRGLVAVVLTAAAVLFVFGGPEQYRNFQNFRTEGKPLRRIIKYEWNHLIRTDHVPGWYVLDGEAATQIVRWDEREKRKPVTKPAYSVAPERPSVAIIGVGGGRQLAEALRADASRILAIDINPTILRWVRGPDRALTNDLFFDPRVVVREGEGRHVVRSARERFDVIVIHAIDTYAAAASGAYALTENFLYTKEAFRDYLRSLTDDGILTISRWLFYPPRENMRLFTTALAALEEAGVEDPLQHVAVVAPVPVYERLGDRRVWGYVLVRKRPFTPEALARLRKHVVARRWSLVFDPQRETDTPFDAYAHARDRNAFQRSYPYLIAPVTDSSPYLFQFYNPLHETAYEAPRDWATVHIYQWSSITLLITLAASLVLSIALIIAPLLWAKRSRRMKPPVLGARHALYFIGLGVGYMAVEVPIVQILSLYLGHPTYGFSVVLVALLVSSGVGSLLIDRREIAPWRTALGVALLLIALTGSIFTLVHATLDLPAIVRFGGAIALVALCGLPMGMPLAAGVRLLGREDDSSVAWAWGINGAASVVGACLVMIAMVFVGSHAALALGVASYLLSAAAALGWSSLPAGGKRWAKRAAATAPQKAASPFESSCRRGSLA